MADFQKDSGVPGAARITEERDLVVAPNLWKWVVEGKVFEAGFSPEDADIDSAAAFADTTPTFGLKAPAASTVLVVPIILRLMMYEDGGALSVFDVAFTKPAGLTATAHTLTGTAFPTKHSLYQSNPAQTAQQAEALHTCTQSAMVATDYVSIYRGHVVDAALTVGLMMPGSGTNVKELNFLRDGAPHIMTSGACMVIYTYTATSDSTWLCYMQWAELTEDDLL